jgi:hypothetical protein
MSASGTHHPTEFKHAADMEWEMGRFGNVTKFLFHPRWAIIEVPPATLEHPGGCPAANRLNGKAGRSRGRQIKRRIL